jgi:Tol biopolymer transport system component
MRRYLSAAALAAALLAPSTAAALPAGTTQLLDRPSGFGALPFDGVNDSTIGTHALSADGRFVVFTSGSDLLLPGDENTATNVYRLDRSNGTIVQVNTTADGAQPNLTSTSNAASISADGRFVEFSSNATNLVGGAPAFGIYVKDLQTGAIELASRATGANGAPATSPRLAVISGDGRHVAFTASGPLHADNADGPMSNTDAYVRALDAGTTHMVSVTGAGAEAGGVSSSAPPDIDFSGDVVAFITSAQIDPTDDTGGLDAYVRTGIGGIERTLLASFATGQSSAGIAEQVALSGDARFIAWHNGFGSVYMARLGAASVSTAVHMSEMQPGGNGDAASTPAFEPAADAATTPARLDFLGFDALDPADTNGTVDLYGAEVAHPGDSQFVHLETSGKANGPVEAGASAADGNVVVFTSAATSLPGGDGVRGQVYLHAGTSDTNLSQPTGTAARTSGAASAFVASLHSVSDDGRTVVFSSEAPALGAAPSTQNQDRFIDEVFTRDVLTGQTRLVSAAPDGTPGNDSSGGASIDAAGDRVAFISSAGNLVPGVQGRHAYIRDLKTGATTLVDRTATGAPLLFGADDVRISADGSHVVYEAHGSDAPGAPANDNNDHVYVVDLATGSTVLADRATDGAIANSSSFRIEIDGDGGRVAFVSAATNLGAGDPGGKRQVYVRDVSAQTTTWASVPEDTNPQHANADQPSLSRDGHRIAFDQFDPGFGHGMTGNEQVFVDNLDSGATQLVSLDRAGQPFGLAAFQPSLSADGTKVAFGAETSTAPAGEQVWLRNLSAQTTTLLSVGRDGSTPARLGAFGPSLSGTGNCVAFGSRSDDLVSPGYGPDFNHVYLRAVTGDCPAGSGSGAGAGSGGPGGTTGDHSAPRILNAHLTHRRFVTGTGHGRGTAIAFTLTENASTTITITRHVAGRRSGRQCVAPRHGLKHRCTRTLATGKLVRPHTRAGANRIAFSGRLGRVMLRPGTYQLHLQARDSAGNKSRTVTLTFVVLRAR